MGCKVSGNLSERVFLFLELGLASAVINILNDNHRINHFNQRLYIVNCYLVVVKVVFKNLSQNKMLYNSLY